MKSDKKRQSGPRKRDRNVEASVLAAVERLEEDIVLGMLHPRERLIEDELCERFGQKRHVVRLVLMELELRGLVERRKHMGALVKSFTAEEVVDLYAIRTILETGAARIIPAPVPEERLATVLAAQEQHDAAVKKSDFRGVFHANIEFHRALFSLCPNKILTEAITEYEKRTQPIRFSSSIFPNYLARVQTEHHQMIEALRTGDNERLVALCSSHLEPARNAYLETHYAQRALAQVTPRMADAPAV